MVSINATLVLQVIQFLVILFILDRMLFRPILKTTTERESFLEKSKLDMRNMESETERLKNMFLAKESETRKRASQQGSELKNAAIEEMDKLVEESAKSAAAIKSEALQRAEEQLVKARPLLDGEARILADDIVTHVMGRRLGS